MSKVHHHPHLRARIHQGIASGKLTKDEVQQLRGERQNIRAAREQARADGQISQEEKQGIRDLVRQMSRDTFALKHNDTTRDG